VRELDRGTDLDDYSRRQAHQDADERGVRRAFFVKFRIGFRLGFYVGHHGTVESCAAKIWRAIAWRDVNEAA
jgi:hypothetical protein